MHSTRAACSLCICDETTAPTPTPTPAPCTTFSATGYLYDPTFQSEEYVNGFLNIHLRMLPKYNDGRNWVVGFNLYRADCTFQWVQISMPAFAIPAGNIDYSVRFTSATHFDIWDDDTQTMLTAPVGYTWVTDLPATIPADGSQYTQVSFEGYVQDEGTDVISTSAPVQGSPPPQRDPVIIIPGMLGTNMQDQDVVLWPNLADMLLDPTSTFMNPLAMNSNGTPTDANVFPNGILTAVNYTFGTFHYSDTLTQLLVANGYVDGKSMFTFPYDWRLDPKTLANELATEVNSVLSSTGVPQVDIVAHSYGGLVLKQYLADIRAPAVTSTSSSTASSTYTPSEAEQHIGKLVFVAVPNLGAAEAAKALIFGSGFGVPLLSDSEIQVLAANMPSIYSLLPSADSYSYLPGFYDDLANPQVKAILNHDQAESMLLGLGKNASMLTAADQFHSTALDEFNFSGEPYQAYNIVGCGVFTLKTIDRMYSGTATTLSQVFRGPKYRIFADSGDGTVLLGSADHLAVPSGNTYYVNGGQHSQMLSNVASASQILEILAGQPIETAPGVTQNSSTCTLQGKLISYDQGMDITITDLTTNTKVDPSTFPSENLDTGSNLFIPTGTGQNYSVTLTPTPVPDETEAAGTQPSGQDISVTQVTNQTSTVNNYDDVPALSQDPITVGVGDAATSTVTDESPSGATAAVAPTASFDQSTLNSVAPLVTTIRAYVGQVLPASGVLSLNEADPQIQFSISDPTNFVSYNFSFDGGATFTTTIDPNAIEEVPVGTGSVVFYSISKQDMAEVPQTVSLDWTVTPQTITETEPASSPTVVVEPAQQPTPTPTPLPSSTVDQDDSDSGAPAWSSASTSTSTSTPNAQGQPDDISDDSSNDNSIVPGSSLDDSSADQTGGEVSVDTGAATSAGERSIPPININITVRQLGEPVDNTATATASIAPNEATSLLAAPVPQLSSGIFSAIWKFLSAIAHLIFI